jgi:two-component system response regulator
MKENHMILLVEDNADDEALTMRALKKNNISNQIVITRHETEVPQLILLDLKLPKLDGFEVLKRLRADPRTRLIPVVILTSSKEQQDIVQGYGLGANSYVRKPVDFQQFIESVRQLGLYWLVINERPSPEHSSG